MFIIKYLLSAFLLTGSIATEENGWVAVERAEKGAGESFYDDVDRSIWVAFAKQMGPEKILVNFPQDPSYRYLDGKGEELEVTASSIDADYRLQVLKRTFVDGDELYLERLKSLGDVAIASTKVSEQKTMVEFTYWDKGYWHFERWISTPHHTYFFEVASSSLEEASPDQFADSFDLVIDEKYTKK